MKLTNSVIRFALPLTMLAGLVLGLHPVPAQDPGAPLVFPGANSRETYFTVHNVGAAHEHATGAGVRVGILDHSFAFEAHPELYAGGEEFLEHSSRGPLDGPAHHGYWMALVLREIAPKAEIYALNTSTGDEGEKVDAMVRAIDWAIEHELDALTYSDARFAPEHRGRLDDAVDRALDAGIVTTFIHYPHEGNLLPSGMFGRSGDDEREPDVNILHYDYTVVFPQWYREHQEGKARPGWRPFLSVSSTSPVTAGFVALLLELEPDLTPEDCKEILRSTARPRTFEGAASPRVVDAARAVEMVVR